MEEVTVTTVGAYATVPEPGRSLSTTLVQIGGDRTLVDCGEGTVVALTENANCSPYKIDRVLLTHYHADHYLGLPGFIKKRGLNESAGPLDIYALPSVCERLRTLLSACFVQEGSEYILHALDVDDSFAIKNGDFMITAFRTNHRAPSAGFIFQEREQPGRFDGNAAIAAGVPSGPIMGTLARGGMITLDDGTVLNGADFIGPRRRGRKLVVTGDTAPCPELVTACSGADLVVIEATFLAAEQELAVAKSHMSTQDIADLVNMLGDNESYILNHLSHRYTRREYMQEIKQILGERAEQIAVARDGYKRIVLTGR